MTRTSVSLGQALEHALLPVFGGAPTFFSEDTDLLALLGSHGCATAEFSAATLPELPAAVRENAVVLLTSLDHLSWPLLDGAFHDSRMMVIPFASFDPSLDAMLYTLERLAESHFERAAASNAAHLAFLTTRRTPFRFAGRGCDLRCELTDKIHLMKPKEEAELLPGEWEAVGMWFETAMLPDEEDVFHPGHLVNGTVVAQGAAVARHKQMPQVLTPLHREAWALMHDLQVSGRFPLTVQVEDSRVTRVRTAAGEDLWAELLRLTNERLEMMMLEMAVSGNSGLDDTRLDWRRNSVINEGARGIHIGIGDGVTGAHIDLIAPGVELLP